MSGLTAKEFFKQTRDQSEVKSEILNEYFKTWAAILLRGQSWMPINSLLYIDLYAGKGYYDDKKPSTPIKILTSINNDLLFNQKIKSFFNDNEIDIINALEKNITELPFYNELINKPVFLNEQANQDLLNELLRKENRPPSLTFIDPLGYKGVSAGLCLSAVKDWGSDLFMLFNINRIRPGIKNTTVEHLMRDLFADKFELILKQYDKLNKKDREDFILDQFILHFKEKRYRAIKFKVEFEDKKSSSHYLLFVSKVDIAYFRMKEIMSKYSDYQADGVPWFTVNNSSIQDLFSQYSIINLKSDLLKMGKELNNKSIEQIYHFHSIDTPYIKQNYKQAFTELIKEEKVIAVDKNGNKKSTPAYSNNIKFKN